MNPKPDPEMIDDENPEWTDKMAARAVHFDDLPPSLKDKLRGQQKAPLKVATTIRLSPEVIEYFKRDGKGWQTRLNSFLRDAVAREKRKAG